MYDTITQADILRAATELAIADMKHAGSTTIKVSLLDACEALIDAGLVPIGVAPDVWRCLDDKPRTIEALHDYINSQ